jgi:hypothetical protein
MGCKTIYFCDKCQYPDEDPASFVPVHAYDKPKDNNQFEHFRIMHFCHTCWNKFINKKKKCKSEGCCGHDCDCI